MAAPSQAAAMAVAPDQAQLAAAAAAATNATVGTFPQPDAPVVHMPPTAVAPLAAQAAQEQRQEVAAAVSQVAAAPIAAAPVINAPVPATAPASPAPAPLAAAPTPPASPVPAPQVAPQAPQAAAPAPVPAPVQPKIVAPLNVAFGKAEVEKARAAFNSMYNDATVGKVSDLNNALKALEALYMPLRRVIAFDIEPPVIKPQEVSELEKDVTVLLTMDKELKNTITTWSNTPDSVDKLTTIVKEFALKYKSIKERIVGRLNVITAKFQEEDKIVKDSNHANFPTAEARNVSHRLGITPEQYRKTFEDPSQGTFDEHLALRDLIVNKHNTSVDELRIVAGLIQDLGYGIKNGGRPHNRYEYMQNNHPTDGGEYAESPFQKKREESKFIPTQLNLINKPI